MNRTANSSSRDAACANLENMWSQKATRINPICAEVTEMLASDGAHLGTVYKRK